MDDRLHTLLEQIPAALAIVRGPDFVYELSNEMNQALTGGRPLVGRRVLDALPEAVPSGLLAVMNEVYRTGVPFRATEYPAEILGADGKPRQLYLNGSYEPLRGPDGQVEGIVAFAYEVTEVVAARRRAEASEARLRRLYDAGVIGIVFWTRDGTLVDANDAFLSMVGYTRGEMEKGLVRWRDMTPKEFAHLDERAFAEMEETGICTPYEKEYLHRDGHRIPIQLGISFWEGSRTEGVAWILDVSKREQAEIALVRSEAQLRTVTDSVPALISLCSADERYVLVNQVYEDWFGVSRDAVIGKTIREVLGDAAYSAVEPHIRAVLAGEVVRFATSVPYRTGVRDVRATYVPHRGPTGQVEGYVALIVDISEERQRERERAELLEREHAARETAEAAVKLREEFLSVASHELKTPLTSLSLQFEAMTRAIASGQRERTDDQLVRMRSSVQRLARLVDELLDVTRIAAGDLPLTRGRVDARELLEEVVRRFEEQARAEHSPLAFEVESGVVGDWDRSRIDQVLTNVIGNALKYGRGAPVRVRLYRGEGVAHFEVQDGGLGIAPADHARIFERFERATTARHFAGLGLGLWIARSVVEAHGGSISVESETGAGATFLVSLPIV